MRTKRHPRPEQAEREDLRARLDQAEEVLRAIREGEVDAVVVSGGRGEQIYTLSGADRAYRQLIETMREGAATLSPEGVILYGNAYLAEMLKRPLDQVPTYKPGGEVNFGFVRTILYGSTLSGWKTSPSSKRTSSHRSVSYIRRSVASTSPSMLQVWISAE